MKRMDITREQSFAETFPVAFDIIKEDWNAVTNLAEPKQDFDIFKSGI